MTTTLAILLAALGTVLVTRGLLQWFRTRPQGADRARRRRTALAQVGVGGTMTLIPDQLVHLLVQPATEPSTAQVVLMVLYRLGVIGALAVVALTMVLTGDPVTLRARRAADAVRDALPTRAGLAVRRQRRSLPGFPTAYAELVEHDRALQRRLLAHHGGAGIAEDLPALADLTDPRTRAAVEAMFHCDATRPEHAPLPGRDLLTTPYGQAVAAFEQALTAAERHAQEAVRAGAPASRLTVVQST